MLVKFHLLIYLIIILIFYIILCNFMPLCHPFNNILVSYYFQYFHHLKWPNFLRSSHIECTPNFFRALSFVLAIRYYIFQMNTYRIIFLIELPYFTWTMTNSFCIILMGKILWLLHGQPPVLTCYFVVTGIPHTKWSTLYNIPLLALLIIANNK